MSEGFLSVLLGLSGLLVASSLVIHLRFNQIMAECSRIVPSTGITGSEFIQQVIESEGLTGVEVDEETGDSSGGYLFHRKMVKVPDLNDTSLLVLGVSSHEISHAEQGKYRPSVVKIASIMGDLGVIFSYLFPLFLVLGFIIYFPLVYIGLVIYLSILLVVLVEVPVEVDAMRKAVDYLDTYAELRKDELGKLKRLLRWAILTRIAYLTGAFLVLFSFRNKKR